MDLTQIFSLSLKEDEKPYYTLTIGGERVKFLCDSGADRTVLKDKNPAVKPRKKWIAVVSANGKVQMLKISKPTSVLDEDGEGHTAELVISPDCPVNLLGRDLMKQIRIALVPTEKGMRPEKMTSAYVHEG